MVAHWSNTQCVTEDQRVGSCCWYRDRENVENNHAKNVKNQAVSHPNLPLNVFHRFDSMYLDGEEEFSSAVNYTQAENTK